MAPWTTRFTFSGQAQASAIVYPSRNVDLELPILAFGSTTAAGITVLIDDLTHATASRAGLTNRKEATLDMNLSTPAASSANPWLRTGFRTGSIARLAGLGAWELDFRLRPKNGVFELNFDLVLQVRTASHSAATTAASSEEITENIPENVASISEISRIKSALTSAAHARMTELVVLLAFRVVAEYRVGLGRRLEAILSFVITRVPIRVVLHRQLSVSALDDIGRCAALNTERFVVILLCHS